MNIEQDGSKMTMTSPIRDPPEYMIPFSCTDSTDTCTNSEDPGGNSNPADASTGDSTTSE